MLVSSARVVYRYEQMLELERAKREVRSELRAGAGFPSGATFGGFDVSLLERTERYERWRIAKTGERRQIEGTIFVPPR